MRVSLIAGSIVLLVIVLGAAIYYYSYHTGSQPKETATSTSSSGTSSTPTSSTRTTTTSPGSQGGEEKELLLDVSTVEIRIPLNTTSGSKTYTGLATITANKNTCIVLKPVLASYTGNESFTVSGKALLEPLNGSGKTYTITMPCMAGAGMPCFRIQVVIPGYDEPLRLEPGKYRLSLNITWTTKTKSGGEALVVISIEKTTCPNPAWLLISYDKPKNTTGWITAKGSTRSYTLLVDKKTATTGKKGLGVFKLYFWVFQPQGTSGPRRVELSITDDSGAMVGQAVIPLARRGVYQEFSGTLALPPGHYTLKIVLGKRAVLEQSLVVVARETQ